MGAAEAHVEKYLVTQCKKHNILCWKFTSPGRTGVPDRIVIARGRTVFVETKARDGILSPRQKVVIAELKEHGAEVRVANTRELVDEFLIQLTY